MAALLATKKQRKKCRISPALEWLISFYIESYYLRKKNERTKGPPVERQLKHNNISKCARAIIKCCACPSHFSAVFNFKSECQEILCCFQEDSFIARKNEKVPEFSSFTMADHCLHHIAINSMFQPHRGHPVWSVRESNNIPKCAQATQNATGVLLFFPVGLVWI